MLRPDILSALRPLLLGETKELSLDAVAEAIGALPISTEEIDEVFTWLEQQGRVVGEGTGPGSAALPAVLAAARRLKAELGRTPSVAEIVAQSGLSREAVQRALFFARIVQR